MPEMVAELPEKPQIDAPKRQRARKLDWPTIQRIASFVGGSLLTEAEACRQLSIDPQVWAQFKLRNPEIVSKFEYEVSRISSKELVECGKSVKKARRRDWRAAVQWAKWTDPKRFGDAVAQPQNVQVNVFAQWGIDTDRLVDSRYNAATDATRAIVDVEHKQVEDVKPEQPS